MCFEGCRQKGPAVGFRMAVCDFGGGAPFGLVSAPQRGTGRSLCLTGNGALLPGTLPLPRPHRSEANVQYRINHQIITKTIKHL